MLLVVIDTNLFISSFITPRSLPGQLVDRWQNKEFKLVTCPQIVDEIDVVLQRPKFEKRYNIGADKREQLLRKISVTALLVRCDRLTGIVDDPKDDKFVACAIEGNAKYLITGDDDLLRLKRYRQTRMVTARHFITALDRCQRRYHA